MSSITVWKATSDPSTTLDPMSYIHDELMALAPTVTPKTDTELRAFIIDGRSRHLRQRLHMEMVKDVHEHNEHNEPDPSSSADDVFCEQIKALMEMKKTGNVLLLDNNNETNEMTYDIQHAKGWGAKQKGVASLVSTYIGVSLFNCTMGATNTMALLGYVSFLSSSPIVTLATPSLTSQEDNSDLDDDDIIPNGSTTASPLTSTPTTTFFMTSIKGVAPPPAPSCAICGSPVVDSVIIRSPTLPSSPAVSSFPNSPNNLFTLSDLKHRDPDYIQAHSTIYANDSTWRWWNYLVKHQGAIPKARRGAIKDS
ncbi:hypothetical protein D6C78_10831, partial [Aureobasidium pullulans]